MMTALGGTYQAIAFPGSDAIAPPGSVGQMSNRQAEPILHRRADLHVAYWNVRVLQDVEALIMRDLRRFLAAPSSKDSNPRETSALVLIKVSLGLDVDARIRCTTCVVNWSSVGASRKQLSCASLILVLRLIPWTGTPYDR